MSLQKRAITTYIAFISVLIILACQTASKFIYPATPTPNGTLQSTSSYDGDWQGTTSQNKKVTFTISHGDIVIIKISATLIGPSCVGTQTFTTNNFIEPTALAAGNFTPLHPIKENAFIITDEYSDSFGHTSNTVIGTFTSSVTASGTFESTAPLIDGCDGTAIVDWKAEKILE